MGKSKKFNINILIIALVWIMLIACQTFLVEVVNSDALLTFICIETLFIFVIILINLVSNYKTIFRVLTLFVIMFFIYLQGQVMLNVFNLTSNGLLSGKFGSKEIIGGILDVHLFMAMFLIGVATVQSRRKKIKNNTTTKINQLYDKDMLTAGYAVMLCSLPFELYVNFRKLYFTLTYGYASLYQEVALNSISSGSKILSYFFLPGCFYLFFASERKSRTEKLSLMLLLFHSVVELLIGYRASAMIPIILVLYGLTVKSKCSNSPYLSRKTKKTIFKYCVLAVIVVIFVFPIVRESRNDGGLANVSINNYFSVENYRELFTTINDMGKSLQTVIYTKQIVPHAESYRYGVSYLMNLPTIIPNFFWDRHPAEVYGSLGRWLTKIVDHDFWEFGGALGFSCVAEAYVNFGYFGIIIFGFLLGRILQSTETKIEASGKAINYASYAIIAVYLLSYPRGELSDLIRGIFWYMLIPRLFYTMIKRRKRNNV